jgi:hypothetical protein
MIRFVCRSPTFESRCHGDRGLLSRLSSAALGALPGAASPRTPFTVLETVLTGYPKPTGTCSTGATTQTGGAFFNAIRSFYVRPTTCSATHAQAQGLP